jgi:hypothetical protein
VPALAVAVTGAWSPNLTEPMPSRRAATILVLVTAQVLIKPSSPFSVIDDRLTAVTLPF